MRDTAIVIPIGLKIESNSTIWCLSDLAGKTGIERLLERLIKGLPTGEFDFYVVCQSGWLAEKFRSALGSLPVTLVTVQDVVPLNLFSSFISLYPTVRTLCVFPERAIFPGCRITYEMVIQHRRHKSEATRSPSLPEGLVPEIYQSSAIKRLVDLGLTDDLNADFWQIMEKANALFVEDATYQFEMLTLAAETFKSIRPKDLPARLLVRDGVTLEAAAQVLALNRAAFDSTEAYDFKKAILTMNETKEFTFSVPKKGASGRKVVLLNTRFGGYSGAQECFFKIITHLDRTRFDPVVSLPYEGTFSQKLRAAGIAVEIGLFDMEEITPWSLRYFQALFTHTGAQLVHIDGDPSPALVLQAFEQKIPLVYHLTEFLGRSAGRLYQFADRILSISQAVTADVLQADLPASKVVTLFESLDLSAYDPSRYDKKALRAGAQIPPNSKVLVIIARLVPEKKVDMILRIFPQVLERFPDVFLLIVGEASPSFMNYKAQLEQLAAQPAIAASVRFWGFEKDIAKIFAMSDVLISCRPNEPVGHSILEALAMRIPVVAPNRGGHNEILRHNENALLFEVNNEKSLVLEVSRLLADQALSDKLVTNGRKTIESLDLPSYMLQLSRIYDELIP